MPSTQLFGASKLTAQTAVMAMVIGLLGTGAVLGVASPAEGNGAPQCSVSASTNVLYSGVAGQDGSDFSKAYRISTAADLIRISQTPGDWSNKFFLQTADIDLGGCYFDPIGYDINSQFSGGFYDGGFFKISGLNIDDVSGAGGFQGVGLFGYSSGSTIRNLTVSGSISSNSPSVGGILGRGTASITAVRSEINIDFDGYARAGGVVGELEGGVLSYSSYEGTIRSLGVDHVGGLVGGQAATTFASYAVSVPEAQVRTTYAAFRGGGLFAQLYSSNTSQSYAVVPESTYGITYGAGGNTSSGLFWRTSDGPSNVRFFGSLTGATGKTTAEMQSIDTYTAASWDIVSGWEPFDSNNAKVWGICSLVNNGYPFLLWEYSSNPCVVAASPVSSGSSVAPPSSAVAEMSITGSGLKKSSLLRVRLSQMPMAFEQLVLVVRLTDFQNVLIQELRVPILATATFVDVPIDIPMGQFNVVALTSNTTGATLAVNLVPQTLKQRAIRRLSCPLTADEQNASAGSSPSQGLRFKGCCDWICSSFAQGDQV